MNYSLFSVLTGIAAAFALAPLPALPTAQAAEAERFVRP